MGEILILKCLYKSFFQSKIKKYEIYKIKQGTKGCHFLQFWTLRFCHANKASQPVPQLGASIQSSSFMALIRHDVYILSDPPGSKMGSSVSVTSANSLFTLRVQVDCCLLILHSYRRALTIARPSLPSNLCAGTLISLVA